MNDTGGPLFGSAPAAPLRNLDGSGPGKDERAWATFCHVSALAGFILPVVPFSNVLGPLVMWLLKKDEYPFVCDQGREAVNFQLSMAIYLAASLLLCLILVGFLLLVALCVIQLIVVVRAALTANEGLAFRYPFCIRFLK